MSFNPITDAPAVIAGFLGYMQTIKGKSANTIKEYYIDLRTFFRYMKIKYNLVDKDTKFQEISIDDIDIDFIKKITLMDVFEFMSYTISERNNDNATRARKSSSLRGFFKYLTNKTGQLDINPVEELEIPKLKKSLPKYLTLDQSIMLLDSIEGEYYERDYCIITLFLNCGLRLSELVGINYLDIHENTITVTGKGNKQRVVYLNHACLTAIKNYMKVRPNHKIKNSEDKKALFISRLNIRMGRQAVYLMVKKYLDKIGLSNQGYSVHKLRHTSATLMYQHGGVDIRALKDILGHQSLGTTQIYTHLSNKQLEEASKKTPLANINSNKSKL